MVKIRDSSPSSFWAHSKASDWVQVWWIATPEIERKVGNRGKYIIVYIYMPYHPRNLSILFGAPRTKPRKLECSNSEEQTPERDISRPQRVDLFSEFLIHIHTQRSNRNTPTRSNKSLVKLNQKQPVAEGVSWISASLLGSKCARRFLTKQKRL